MKKNEFVFVTFYNYLPYILLKVRESNGKQMFLISCAQKQQRNVGCVNVITILPIHCGNLDARYNKRLGKTKSGRKNRDEKIRKKKSGQKNRDEIGMKSGRSRDEIGTKSGQNWDKIGTKIRPIRCFCYALSECQKVRNSHIL